MAVRIQGKTDTHPVILLLHRNDEFPSLCIVRQLLAWIAYSGYQVGTLFPTERGSLVPLPYKRFLAHAKAIALRISGRNGPFGTHYLRKTAWLLAVWGNGQDVDMMAASRHKTLKQASRYKQDAGTMLQIARNSGYSFNVQSTSFS